MKPVPGRVRRPTRGRVVSWTVLVLVGCVATLAVLLGDQLSRWLGLAALLAGTVLACLLAWRENRTSDRLREARSIDEAARFYERLHGERRRHAAVLTVLTRRTATLHRRAAAAERTASLLQQELSTLRGNYEALRVELEMQASLSAEADIVELVRRGESIDPWVTARQLWLLDDSAPSLRRPA